MKKIKLAIVMGMFIGSSSLLADPGVMVGITLNTNGDLGLSINALSSDKENKTVATAGLSFFPSASDPIGLTLGVGQNFENMSVSASWDVIRSVPQIGIGYMDTRED